jgi:formylglycine-generating enzyme required for sulfatase activity
VEGRLQKAGPDWANPSIPVTPDTPAVGINWFDAERFCQWLTDHDRKKGKISARQYYRLPSVAEISQTIGLKPDAKLTRLDALGITTGEGAPEDLGPDPLPDWPPAKITNVGPNLGRETDAATRPAPNQPGFQDLAGNVWEWQAENETLPQNPAGLRGGSWRDENPIALRSDIVWADINPYLRLDNIGFRVVLAEE